MRIGYHPDPWWGFVSDYFRHLMDRAERVIRHSFHD